jgi:isoamylase
LMISKRLSPWVGHPYPLGATWDGDGVNFAVFSEHARHVKVCLFDETGQEEIAQVPLPAKSDNVWHGYIRGLGPGTIYGYRVFGAYEPQRGSRFNPNKLLLDPYAKSLFGKFTWHDAHFGYKIGDRSEDLSFDKRDNAPYNYKCKVIDPGFDWEGDRHPRTAWRDTIIYELNVKGFTKRHPKVPEELRGTYAGLGAPAALKHFKRLGITAVEIMPVHAFLDERNLIEKGLSNYWGYNTIAFFAPEPRYGSGEPVNEFKTMVKKLHAAGIEVILDVVYNHTVEGNHFGPTLSLRGIDNASYYRLVYDNPRYYMDYTGCGNTLNVMNPRALQLIMDSLRYWVLEMHVDGFRFDLAAALAREGHGVDQLAGFFDIIHQDPVLSQVKLIAEPWDLGEGGYQLGNFPPGWSEWNGQYRDTVRAFWRSDEGLCQPFSRRLTGSSDLYQHNGRGPCSSINLLTSHDGFTLNDMVSYNHKHNEANLDGNQDGENHNLSWNCGYEGPTEDRHIRALRNQQKRNMLTSLLLSHGVPMLTAGDEMGRTQQGNNNAYCQDNEISWLNWDLTVEDETLLQFVSDLIALRKKHFVFRRHSFTNCHYPHKGNSIHWYKPSGLPMHARDWHNGYTRSFQLMLLGDSLQEYSLKGKRLVDDSFLFLINAYWDAIPFILPQSTQKCSWRVVLDTSKDPRDIRRARLKPLDRYMIKPRSLAVLLQERPQQEKRQEAEDYLSQLVYIRPEAKLPSFPDYVP